MMKHQQDKKLLLLKCTICRLNKSVFIKKQEATRLLSNLDLKTPLSKIPILGDVLL